MSLFHRPILCFSAGLLLGPAFVQAAAPAEDNVFRAMRDELARSTTQLKLENNAPPYFVAYRVKETAAAEVVASFGSIVTADERYVRTRTAAVELRVGSPALDQTNFMSGADAPFAPSFDGPLALDDNVAVLRRQLWLLTDSAYRRSLEDLAKKKAALQNKIRSDDTGDFTNEPPTQTESLAPSLNYDAESTKKTARELSAVFRGYPAISSSTATIKQREVVVRYVTSEGTSYLRREPGISIVIEAGTQAPDGRAIAGVVRHIGRFSVDELGRQRLLNEVHELARRLTALRHAALLEDYNGPVLFDGEAAADIFAQNFAWRFVAFKRPVIGTDDVNEPGNPFHDKIGSRVLPHFLNVADDPTRSEFAGAPLNGSFDVDDEGTPTRATSLVERGRLKTLLMSRVPSPHLPKSTGSRRGGGPFLSNLIVTAEDGLAPEGLKAKLVELASERGLDHGVIVRRLVPEIVAFKIFSDGSEQLLRNVQLGELSLETFKDIVFAGHEPFADHLVLTMSRPGGWPSQDVVSVVSPALLFDEIVLKTTEVDRSTLPVTTHPYFER